MAYDLRPIDDEFFRTAPTVAPATVELPNAPEQVWEALGSDQMWSWIPILDQLEWRTPRGEGGIRRLRIAGLIRVEEEFYRWEAPRRATFRVVRATRPFLKALAEDFVLDPLPGGGTKLTWTMAMESTLPPLPAGLVAAGNTQGLAGIKTILPPA